MWELALALIIVAIIGMALFVLARGLKRVTIFEFQRGVKYVDGRFVGVLDPGFYWYSPFWSCVSLIDVRPRWAVVSGQEILTADAVTVKISLAALFNVADPAVAMHEVQDYETALYTELQLALREVVSGYEAEALVATRGAIADQIAERVQPRASAIGLDLRTVTIKDLMFPGKLKEVFAQVVNARLEGLAALERARGEHAALRNLANAAQLLERHPQLVNLRLLQVLGETSGNRIVLDMPPVGAGPSSADAMPPPRDVEAPKRTGKDVPAAKKKPVVRKKAAAKKPAPVKRRST